VSGIFGGLSDDRLMRIAAEILGPDPKKYLQVYNKATSIELTCKYGGFVLREVSGPVVSSVALFVHPQYRKQGWSDKFEAIKRAYCNLAEVKMLVATVRNDNDAQLAAIQSHGWTLVSDLGEVGLWAIRLDGETADICYLA
jgi:hypothetical protein